ncbi:radical SAM protein [Halobacteriaceae archaeon GCM10025711]
MNVATGCTHGCKFCYVPSTPNIRTRQQMLSDRANVEDSQREWGSYLLYRDDLPERLARKLDRKRTWKETERGRGVVMISSGTDCYQDRRTSQITRESVIELVNHNIPVRILTRSPAVTRDVDVYKAAGDLVRVGSSIPTLDDEQARALEPGAPVPSARLKALETLSDEGVTVYVSMSPTYPTQEKEDMRDLLQTFHDRLDPEVVFHEPINPRGQNFDMTVNAARDVGQEELADELEKLKDKEYWMEYSLDQMRWAEELSEDIGIDVHVWPDKQVVNALDGDEKRKWSEQIEAVSPEKIPDVTLST